MARRLMGCRFWRAGAEALAVARTTSAHRHAVVPNLPVRGVAVARGLCSLSTLSLARKFPTRVLARTCQVTDAIGILRRLSLETQSESHRNLTGHSPDTHRRYQLDTSGGFLV
jgi:hypothetical protein